MKPRHKVSPAALELIKSYEGLRRTAAQAPDGRWTVGYGHTRSAREGATVSAADAEALLLYDVRTVAAAVNGWTFAPLTQNQFDALVAFAFNVGLPAFRTSNVLRRVNEGSHLQAASALDGWRRAEFEGEAQVIDGLVRRRAAEKALFLSLAEGPVVVPTPILPPRMDYGVGVLQERPLELVSPLEGDAAPSLVPPRATPEAPAQPQRRPAAAAAADNVSERLRALFPDARPPEAQAGPVDAPFAPETPDDPPPSERRAESPFPPAVAAPEAVAPAELTRDAADLDPARLVAPPAPPTPPVATLADAPSEPLAPTPEADPERPVAERWPYLLLFLGGAVLFVAGISASMEGRALLGLPLSFVGTGCIAVAVYFLLKRIDGRD